VKADGVAKRAPFLLAGFVPYQLTYCAWTVSRALMQELRQFRLNVAEWRIIAIIGSFAPLSTRNLVAYTTLEKTRVSRATSSLIQRGYVVRSIDPVDKRLLLLRLSSRGKTLYRRMVARARKFEQALLRGMTVTEVRLVLRQLDRLRKAALAVAAPKRAAGGPDRR
jgi:DNA-binding MarR family transcriptional regulator